ncbi:N-acetylglucosamine-6-phosphate deacetylase [Aureimonas jatrophae]|uniref:N-acetylglucosamine 6-phosphate deacetylase n=1 Tax=Aureimonas jatrophae TaxID=1166073 RepID=A0A1H0JNF6_9HYPH|nr:N-acetylglucosamine-6-phosphate deacetylase [Aureimonas jatrophae]MBB3951318.1 N-acetylglucosamine-6-phosphate deacetylase [Aureimonas jatrophae]SDO45278.1 N-acetylglucosamine 6-phosphate deacetylase [Aureimonas jatrophae]
MTDLLFTGCDIFDGERRRSEVDLRVRDGRVVAIEPMGGTDADEIVRVPGGLLAPGFVDIQVNGGGGVLLNETPSVDGVRTICETHARFGTTALLPTVITDRPEVTFAALDAVAQALASGVPGCAGIHVEGPFIAKARKGAHDPSLIRPMTEEDLRRLVASPVRPLLITVATESVTNAQIARLAEAGLHVSIGHCDASYDEAMAAFENGANCVTHLFNAMSQLGHRDPGLAAAALDHPGVWAGIIPDGHHVHPAMVALALRAKRGERRMIAISDAMPTVGVADTVFTLSGRTATRENGRLTLDDGTLAGADVAVIDVVRFLVNRMNVPLEEALRLSSRHPAEFLRQEGERGCLRRGARADIVWLSDELDVRGVWIGGKPVPLDA